MKKYDIYHKSGQPLLKQASFEEYETYLTSHNIPYSQTAYKEYQPETPMQLLDGYLKNALPNVRLSYYAYSKGRWNAMYLVKETQLCLTYQPCGTLTMIRCKDNTVIYTGHFASARFRLTLNIFKTTL